MPYRHVSFVRVTPLKGVSLNARLKRPILAVVVSSALLAGGAFAASPALASDSGRSATADAGAVLADEPTPDPSETTPTPEPSETTPAPDPSETTSAPEPSDTPTTSAPEPSDTPTTSDPEPSGTTTPPVEPSSPPTSTPPVPDTIKPTGKFSLNTTSLWVGQKVTFTQGAVTDNGPVTEVTRVVSWGDGTSTTLKATGQAPVNKQYTRNGKFTITLTVTDKAKNSSKTSSVLNVTVPGKFKISKYSIWPGERVTTTFSSVPAGTTRIRFDNGDGYVQEIKPKNQAIKVFYYHRKNGGLIKGKVTLRATFYNKFGASSAVYVGVVNVKTDSWKPVVSVKKPKNPTKIKSWKTVTGTVSDKGSGAPYVYVWVTRINGSAVYCYTPAKKWKRVYSEEQYNNCAPVAITPSKGKWSLKINGLGKGTVYVDARAWDWADNASKWASIQSKVK
ncbi:hypothetical protein Ahu01nite_042160 [Winogradskya humida]|uniref:PKD domain-containing protein n=1 Tax=Winogradskya humida TaxID=113566 RepID=A0ABQ3ZRA7_9ACTN|nr:hypothetical protein Ahu01nite_042160 [Actinoplanes humidus]